MVVIERTLKSVESLMNRTGGRRLPCDLTYGSNRFYTQRLDTFLKLQRTKAVDMVQAHYDYKYMNCSSVKRRKCKLVIDIATAISRRSLWFDV